MISDLTPSLGKHTICPQSGLAITTKSSWLNIQTGDDYFMSYGIIGENILFTCPHGNIRTVDMERAIAARDRVVMDHFGTIDPVITEVRNFAQVYGVPSHKTRTLFRQSFDNQHNHKGIFIINMSWIIKSIFVAGLRIHKVPIPLTLSNSYASAIFGALDLLSNKVQTCQTEWSTQTDSVNVVHIIFNNSIIFTKGSGQLVESDIPSLLAKYEKLLQSNDLTDGPIYRIADYTNTTKSDWKARLLLVQGLNKLHTTYNRTPEAMAVYGLESTLQTAMKLAGKILAYPIFFADNETEAFAYIYKKQQRKDVDLAPSPEHSPEIEAIMRFIATIIWDDSKETVQLSGENHTLDPILEALLLVKQDVSDLLQEAKAQTEEIAEKNRLLETEITHRKNVERKLKIALKQAKDATLAKGEFLATMSHEIRTPINGILGMIHLLGNTDLSSVQQNYLKISSNSATALLKLINDILDFSKVDQGHLQMEVTPFNLLELCSDCCSLFDKDIHDKGLELHCKIDKKLTQFTLGDPGKLRQILINLLNNAIKFTATGTVTLRATVKRLSPVFANITFSVRDTGIGIAPEKMETIFETFSQADSSTTRQYGGTGLGLTISRKICEFMEGTLEVTSTINQGTTFTFTLPFGLGDEILNNYPIEAIQQPTQPTQTDFRVLIVEDEAVNQLFVEALLDQFGYQHDHASNGIEAIAAINKKVYHIVLMDCQMPMMDGYEATKKIRSMQLKQIDPIIIALTAHATKGAQERCLKSGMDEYLTKPITPSLLLETIEKYLPQNHE